MKTQLPIIFFLFFVLMARSSFAQDHITASFPSLSKHPIPVHLQEVMQQQKVPPQVKKKRSSSRLIARTSYSYNGVMYELNDSIKYSYCSNFGYDPTPDFFDIDYDNSFYYNDNNLYDTSAHYHYQGGTMYLRDTTFNIFGANHKLVNNYYHQILSNNRYYRTYLYNLNEKRSAQIDSIQYNGNFYKTMRHYLHAGANKVCGFYGYTWDGVTWQNDKIDSIFYDLSGNIVQVKFTIYDSANAVWKTDQTINFTYNAANQVLSVISDWDVNIFGTDTKWDYDYDAASRLVSVTTSEWYNATWINDNRLTYTYAAGIYPVMVQYENWDIFSNSWQYTFRSDYSYNAGNQFEVMLGYQWNAGNNAWEQTSKTIYYYEDFTPQFSESVNTLAADLELYPVPAQHVLNVYVNLDKQQNTEIIIVDMEGRQLMKSIVHDEAKFREKLNVETLPSGNYIFVLKGEKGTLSRKFSK